MKSAVSYTRCGHTSGVTWNLGSLLLEFFYLYGITFNYQILGISIRDGGSYFQKAERVWSNPGRYCGDPIPVCNCAVDRAFYVSRILTIQI